MAKQKIIFDCDMGIDDSMALGTILGSDCFDLLGVVGTYGNVYTEQGTKNAASLLELTGHSEVPVYNGLDHALTKDDFTVLDVSATIHGKNGFGNVALPETENKISKNGVEFLIQSIKKYGSDLTIVTSGPLTNLAEVLRQDSSLVEKMGPVFSMGGALTVPGNVGGAEANISQDPQAAKEVFAKVKDITMVGLDVTQRVILRRGDVAKWREVNPDLGNKWADAVDSYMDFGDKSCPWVKGTYVHDPSAVICAVHPEWFTTLPLYLNVVTEGAEAGRTVAYTEKLQMTDPNVKVCIAVEGIKVRDFLQNAMCEVLK
ncbi:nucleoside hydrolase [Levilactobacillus huananensis]|uniref:nucleoside hydrolase n=1 Tax=Levilactobacillus huananensis TaxID=2486019 RepID=UPI001CDBE2CE|nr:nucleoside hydrolase [Levilactobacillus huananensis]